MKNPLKSEKASPWLVLIISFLVMILVIQVLGWQYNRLAKEEMNSLEMRIEESAARSTLKDFVTSRINKNESQAKILLTERAMEEVASGRIALIDDLGSFEILESNSMGENEFSFLVKIHYHNGGEAIELIKVVKILDRYYIDSLNLPR